MVKLCPAGVLEEDGKIPEAAHRTAIMRHLLQPEVRVKNEFWIEYVKRHADEKRSVIVQAPYGFLGSNARIFGHMVCVCARLVTS